MITHGVQGGGAANHCEVLIHLDGRFSSREFGVGLGFFLTSAATFGASLGYYSHAEAICALTS
jgi:hypothetical protein